MWKRGFREHIFRGDSQRIKEILPRLFYMDVSIWMYSRGQSSPVQRFKWDGHRAHGPTDAHRLPRSAQMHGSQERLSSTWGPCSWLLGQTQVLTQQQLRWAEAAGLPTLTHTGPHLRERGLLSSPRGESGWLCINSGNRGLTAMATSQPP